MAGKGEVRYKLVIDGGEFQKPLDEAGKQLTDFSRSFSEELGGVGKVLESLGPAGLAAAAGIGVLAVGVEKVGETIVGTVEHTAEWANRLQELGRSTQMGTEALQELELAAKTSGLDLESAAGLVTKMEAAIEKGSPAFEKLGLNIKQLSQESPEEAFQQVAEALDSVSNKIEKVGLAREIFGKSGAAALPMIENMNRAAQAAQDMGIVLGDKDVGAAASLAEAGEQLGVVWNGLKNQFVAGLLGGQDYSHVLEDMAPLVRAVGEAFRNWGEVIGLVASGLSKLTGLSSLQNIMGFFKEQDFANYNTKATTAQLNYFNRQGAAPEAAGFDILNMPPVSAAAHEANQKAAEEERKAIEEAKRAEQEKARVMADVMNASQRDMEKYYADEKKLADENAKHIIDKALEAMKAKAKAAEDEYSMEMDMQAYAQKAEEEEAKKEIAHKQQVIGAWELVGTAIRDATGFLEQLGVTADSTTGKMLGLAEAGAQLGASIASGDPAAIIGSSFNVLGDIVGLFHNKVIEQLNDQRDAWFQQQGGVDGLEKSLAEMGQTGDQVNVIMKELYDAKTPEQFKAAVDDVNAAMGLGKQANQALDDAMKKYGISISQLGPTFRQQKMDEQAAALIKDYNILIGAGVSQATVTQKMGKDLNAYVQETMKAGTAIPENLRPAIEAMIKAGTLTDAAGKKITDISQLKFTTSLTEGLQSAVDAINKLVAALQNMYGYANAQAARGGIQVPVNGNSYNPPPGYGGGRPPGMASGGVVRARPGGAPYILGEGGQDELVTPLKGGMGHGTVINLGGLVFNGVTSAEDIVAEIKKALPLNSGGLTSEITKWTATALPHG